MMVKLVLRILLFGVIILLLSFLALHINPNYKKEYVAGIIPKLEKLKSVKGNKIVIIGGSNATFGIDTRLMERQLNIPVVNMALHGGLPLKFILEQVKRHMQEGDILIMSKEYEGLKDQYWNTMRGIELPKVALYDLSQVYVLFNDRKLFESTITGIYRTIEHYIAKYPITPFKEITSVYDSRAFEGDNMSSKYMTGTFEQDLEPYLLHTPNKSAEVSLELKKYKAYFLSKGIHFYVTPPVVMEGIYEDTKILPFWKLFSEATDIPMLNDEKDYTYPREYFFNSHYHTNYDGRRIRTESLIEDIILKKLASRKKVKNTYVVSSKAPDAAGNEKLVNLQENNYLYNEPNYRSNLDLFNSVLGFNVLRRDYQGICIKAMGNPNQNYFRMKINGENLKDHIFNLFIESDSVVLQHIRFRGFGKLETFDTIINLGENNYKLHKKVQQVLYTDNNSYLGISFPSPNILLDDEFNIKEVEVYPADLFLQEYDINFQKADTFSFDVLSSCASIPIKNLIEPVSPSSEIMLFTNRLYTVKQEDGKIVLKDFYDGKLITELNQNAKIKNVVGNTIRITAFEKVE